MSKLKDATMIDATEERKNRFNGESVLLTPHEAKIHDDIFSNEVEATIEDKEAGIDGHSKKWQLVRVSVYLCFLIFDSCFHLIDKDIVMYLSFVWCK